MPLIYLLSMPQDQTRIRNIVGAFNESDLDVYWDRAEPGSAEWMKTADAARAARATVFFFSRSADSPQAAPYLELAADCVAAKTAVCVLLDDVELPSLADNCTTYDLRGWRSRASSLFMLDLIAGVKAKAAGLDPPTPRAARQLLVQRLYIAVPSAIAALAVIIGLYRDLGADRIATPAEAAAWQAIEPNSCEDLRRFLGAHGNGVHAQEAQAALAARRIETRQVSIVQVRPLPLYVPLAGAEPSSTLGRARSSAQNRADSEARHQCQGLGEASSSVVRTASARIRDWQCEPTAGGHVCSASGDAICRMDEPQAQSIETCGQTR